MCEPKFEASFEEESVQERIGDHPRIKKTGARPHNYISRYLYVIRSSLCAIWDYVVIVKLTAVSCIGSPGPSSVGKQFAPIAPKHYIK